MADPALSPELALLQKDVGEWDAASRTMTYLWKAAMPNGQTMAWKETSQPVSDTEQLFRVLFPRPDGGEFEMMRASYRRV